MRIDYVDEDERKFVEEGGLAESLRPNGNDLRIVHEGDKRWISFVVTDENKANNFLYDCIAAMNQTGDPKKRLNTDMIGIEILQIGLTAFQSEENTRNKIMDAIDILSTLVD